MSEQEQPAEPVNGDAEVNGTVKLLYMGQRIGHSGKRYYAWGEVEGQPNDGREFAEDGTNVRSYAKVIQPRAVVGEVYTFATPAGKPGSVFNNSGQYEEAWKNRNQVLAWDTTSDAAAASVLRAGRVGRELEGQVETRLAPFRKAYRDSSTRAERVAILATVVEYITKPY